MASRQVNPPSPPRGPPGGIGDGDDGDRSRNRSKGGDKGGSRSGSKNKKKRDISVGSKGDADGFQKQARKGKAPKTDQERARLDILAAERRLAEAKARYGEKNKDQETPCLQCGKLGHIRYHCPDNPRNPRGNCWDGGKKEADRRRREAASGNNNGNNSNRGSSFDKGRGSSSTAGSSSMGKGSLPIRRRARPTRGRARPSTRRWPT